MRRKKRGDYHVWDATIQASLSVGAVITAGTSESKPLTFSLPESDKTYATRNFHPLNHELLDRVDAATSDVDVDMLSPQREGKSRKRKDAPLFTLDAAQRKLLRTLSNDKSAEEAEETDEGKGDEKMTPVRKAPQKWTAAEKKLFHDTVEKHGTFSNEYFILVFVFLLTMSHNLRQELGNALFCYQFQEHYSDQELLLRPQEAVWQTSWCRRRGSKNIGSWKHGRRQ